jgi:hypothetical protein
VMLVDDDVRPSEALQKEFAGTVWISAKDAPWLAKLPSAKEDTSNGRTYIYGVDTIGNIFIRYSGEPDIKRMTSDFQRVLKASQIG